MRQDLLKFRRLYQKLETNGEKANASRIWNRTQNIKEVKEAIKRTKNKKKTTKSYVEKKSTILRSHRGSAKQVIPIHPNITYSPKSGYKFILQDGSTAILRITT